MNSFKLLTPARSCTVPFTPSQGVCTPSPTNIAASWGWVRSPFQDPNSPFAYPQQGGAWVTIPSGPIPMSMAGPAGLHGALNESSSAYSESSTVYPISEAPISHPSSPYAGLQVVYSPFFPVSMSPMQPGYPSLHQGLDAINASMMPGSPMFRGGGCPSPNPGQQYFQRSPTVGQSNLGKVDARQDQEGLAVATDDGNDSSDSAAQETNSAEAACIARIILEKQGFNNVEPPSQVAELVSLLLAYGLLAGNSSTASSICLASATSSSGSIPSPVGSLQLSMSAIDIHGTPVRRQKSHPRMNADGSIRLNARQRRTLRRAQERAINAVRGAIAGEWTMEQAEEAVSKLCAEQAIIFGSPPAVVSGPLRILPNPPSPIPLPGFYSDGSDHAIAPPRLRSISRPTSRFAPPQ